MLTDSKGYVLDHSGTYDTIGDDSPAEIARILSLPKPEVHIRTDSNGTPYVIKAGALRDDKGQTYFFALGRSLEDNVRTVTGFTRTYFLLLPGMIALTSIAGWLLALCVSHPAAEFRRARRPGIDGTDVIDANSWSRGAR